MIKVEIECTPLIVESGSFTDKDNKKINYAKITFAQISQDKEEAFSANTTKVDIIEACKKGKGKIVKLPFYVIRTETGFKFSLA